MHRFIFIQQISVLNISNMLYNLHFYSSKCRLFHTATLFGFCITHILNTGCAKIWKKKSVAKRLIQHNSISSCHNSGRRTDCWNYLHMRNRREGLHKKFFSFNALGTKRWKLFPEIAWTGLRRRQKISVMTTADKSYGWTDKIPYSLV